MLPRLVSNSRPQVVFPPWPPNVLGLRLSSSGLASTLQSLMGSIIGVHKCEERLLSKMAISWLGGNKWIKPYWKVRKRM